MTSADASPLLQALVLSAALCTAQHTYLSRLLSGLSLFCIFDAALNVIFLSPSLGVRCEYREVLFLVAVWEISLNFLYR